eukprot:1157114-Pelagomonas_calceolata.AAC.3
MDTVSAQRSEEQKDAGYQALTSCFVAPGLVWAGPVSLFGCRERARIKGVEECWMPSRMQLYPNLLPYHVPQAVCTPICCLITQDARHQAFMSSILFTWACQSAANTMRCRTRCREQYEIKEAAQLPHTQTRILCPYA